jgi:AraC-like DNA-binding protein
MSGMPPVATFAGLPDWIPRVGSNDLDEMRWLIRDRQGTPGSVVQHGKGPLGYWQQRLFGLYAHMSCAGTGQAVTVRGQVSGLVLHFAIPPGSVYQLGRRRASTTADSVALLPPGLEFTRTSPAGSIMALRLEATRVQAEVTARTATGDGEICLPFAVPALSAHERGALLTAAADLLTAARRADDPRALAQVDGRLHALVATTVLRRAEPARVGALSASRLTALEAWIDAHLTEPLTLGRLCEEAGVGARSLQKAFEARRGMSPMRHVTERRFAAARQRLRRASPSETVTSIALDCGFDHMGRFALGYKQLFGESPSQTLAGRRADSHWG